MICKSLDDGNRVGDKLLLGAYAKTARECFSHTEMLFLENPYLSFSLSLR